MVLNGLYCADVPLSNYSLTRTEIGHNYLSFVMSLCVTVVVAMHCNFSVIHSNIFFVCSFILLYCYSTLLW